MALSERRSKTDRPPALRRAAVFLREAPFALHLAAGLLLISAMLLRAWLASRITGPWYVDEFLYGGAARSLSADWDLSPGDTATLQFRLYPSLIAPAWLADSMDATYDLAKGINVLLMALGGLALYLWTRRLLSPPHTVLALLLILLLPGFNYAGMLVTENAFFPAFVLSLFAIALVLERPTLVRQGLAFAAIVLASAVRLQGLVLLAVLPTAIALKIVLELRAVLPAAPARFVVTELRRYSVTLGALVVAAVAYVGLKAVQGAPLSSGLGLYRGVAESGYSLREVVRWVGFHFAELSLAVGILPASAFIVVLGLALRRGATTTPAERAFLAVTAAALWWLVLEVGAFASRFALRIEERYVFHVAPLLLVCLLLWVARGVPRPPRLAALAVIAPAALLLTLPLESLLNFSNLSDAFGLVALTELPRLPGVPIDVRLVLGAGVFAAATVFFVGSRRLAPFAVLGAVAAYLAVSSYLVFDAQKRYAAGIRAGAGIFGDPSWIDTRIGRDAHTVLLYAGDPEPVRIRDQFLQTEFWNRSVRWVYKASAFDICCVAQADAHVDRLTGRVVPVAADPTPDYAVVNREAEVEGERISSSGELALYRTRGQLRLASVAEGVYGDGWMGTDAAYSRYVTPGNRPARIVVTLSRRSWTGADVPGNVRVEVGPLISGEAGVAELGKATAVRTWVIHARSERRFVLPTPRPPFRVEVHVEPTFSPSQFGLADTRQLGAEVDFRFLAPRRPLF